MLPYMASYGVHAAVESSKFEIAHIQAFKELIEKEHIDCDFTLTRTFNVFLDEEQSPAFQGRLRSAGHRRLGGIERCAFTLVPKTQKRSAVLKMQKARRL